ncbi:MAG: hypothetical protein H5T73_06860 [Actinobacteria bacterium]|nr:hypothetical protein [Actinomycetota bacterium]
MLADEKRQAYKENGCNIQGSRGKDHGVYAKVDFEAVPIARLLNFALDGESIIRCIFISEVLMEYPRTGTSRPPWRRPERRRGTVPYPRDIPRDARVERSRRAGSGRMGLALQPST